MGTCNRCGEEREYLERGICFFCKRAETMEGNEIKEIRVSHNHGKEIISKTGSVKKGEIDNEWMGK